MSSNLPAQIADAIVSIPKALTPGVVKAIDRLIAASVDIPVAWLHQKKAQIDAKTESYKLVETTVSTAAASLAGGDREVVERAMNTLVRKEYRKQINREATVAAMLSDLRDHPADVTSDDGASAPINELDDDWLNVFERYAEDASSERLQGLWGRVLAGEIRRPGRFSTRTLRFLSEFSQADAVLFEIFAQSAFGDCAPTKLVASEEVKDIRNLVNLEASGLIQGSSGLGLTKSHKFDNNGAALIGEGCNFIILRGKPDTSISYEIVALTPLGQEVISLIGSRDARDAAKKMAFAIRSPEIQEAYLGVLPNLKGSSTFNIMEILWLQGTSSSQTVE
ncbi:MULTISPECIES: DUF2806 domain-containing protein [Rhizobium/Agrobacterium group]|uniref:DUF2806 domain-containing protein n=1 Tax=Rhizobium/Agrobacterium group TaxID=227290 RepID=UPI001F410E83|nr:DUF2806 domain-containing protein [Agrobacterium vitis]